MNKTARRTPSALTVILVGCAILAGLLWFFLIRTAVNNRVYRIPSASMMPTLKLNDVVRVELDAYKSAPPKLGDLVMFKPPQIALHPDQKGIEFCKRCMGEAGDVIEIRKGKLYRNGAEVPEPYLYGDMESEVDFRLIEFKGKIIPLFVGPFGVNSMSYGTVEEFQMSSAADEALALKQKPIAIPTGKLLMMGDNRRNSSDGRMWGLIDVSAVVGRVTKM